MKENKCRKIGSALGRSSLINPHLLLGTEKLLFMRMTDPDFNLCCHAAFPRFHHLSGYRLCLFPWNPETTVLTAAWPIVTSQETNGWSKAEEEEGQQKLKRQRDGKEAAVEQGRWRKNRDQVSRPFSLIFLKNEKVQVWGRGVAEPRVSAENRI